MDVEKKLQYLTRNTDRVIETAELYQRLSGQTNSGSLVVKLGVDPTSPEIHLGHTVPLMKLAEFQRLGYRTTFLIGDFTGRIGDPTGRSSGRKALTSEEVMTNSKEYQRQIYKILDPDMTDIVYNQDWLKDLTPEDMIRLLGKGSLNTLMKRRSVSMRLEEGRSVSIAELVYPFLQAYDSVALKADIELGGQDQLFNLLFGREIQRSYGQQPQVAMTMPTLIGTDGKEKMSKTLDNHISLDDKPEDMFGKIMSIPDELIINYLDLLTDTPYEEVTSTQQGLLRGTLHPRQEKARLGQRIVTQYHSAEEATDAEKHFDMVHRLKQAPENTTIAQVARTMPAYLLLVETKMAKSNSEARRLVKQGGMRIDGKTISDPMEEITPKEDMILNVGKRNWKKITTRKI